MFVGFGYIAIPALMYTYTKINKRRDEAAASGNERKYTVQELRDLGDRAPDFRYML